MHNLIKGSLLTASDRAKGKGCGMQGIFFVRKLMENLEKDTFYKAFNIYLLLFTVKS